MAADAAARDRILAEVTIGLNRLDGHVHLTAARRKASALALPCTALPSAGDTMRPHTTLSGFPPMPAWSLDRARHTYSIPYWSDGYFDVDSAGRMCALPRGAGGPRKHLLSNPPQFDSGARQGAVADLRWCGKGHGSP